MKHFYALLFLSALLQAQEPLPYLETFDSFTETGSTVNFSLDGWTLESNGGTETWEARSFSGNNFAQATSYQSGENMDVWIVSPAIDLSSATSPVFTFDYSHGYFNGQVLSVKISESFDGVVSNSTWTEVTSSASISDGISTGYTSFSSSSEIDLSVFQDTIYIAFQYTADATSTPEVTSTIQIDNVSVKEPTVFNEEPTVLTTGDIVVTSLLGDAPDGFQFIPLVDINEGTVVYFTDNGYTGTELRSGENTVTWTVPSGGVTAGTITTLEDDSSSSCEGCEAYTEDFSGKLSGLSSSGDQIIVYQLDDSQEPFYIFCVTSSSTLWHEDSDSNITALPPGLTDGYTAVAVGAGEGAEAEYDNVWLDPSITLEGSKPEILTIVGDTDNWIQSNSRPSADTWKITSVSLSIDNFSSTKLTIYPNPTSELINVMGLAGLKTAKIYDLSGRKVLERNFENKLDIQSLSRGIYLLDISNKDLSSTFKLIKE